MVGSVDRDEALLVGRKLIEAVTVGERHDAVVRSVQEHDGTLHVLDAFEIRKRIDGQNAHLGDDPRRGEIGCLEYEFSDGTRRRQFDRGAGADRESVDDDLLGTESAGLDEPVVEPVYDAVAPVLVRRAVGEPIARIVHRGDRVTLFREFAERPERVLRVLRIAVATQYGLLPVPGAQDDGGNVRAVRADVHVTWRRLVVGRSPRLEHQRVDAAAADDLDADRQGQQDPQNSLQDVHVRHSIIRSLEYRDCNLSTRWAEFSEKDEFNCVGENVPFFVSADGDNRSNYQEKEGTCGLEVEKVTGIPWE